MKFFSLQSQTESLNTADTESDTCIHLNMHLLYPNGGPVPKL